MPLERCVFVYGTLRKHESNHHLLTAAARIASQARVRGCLYDTGCGYPAMVVDPNRWTYGEVYRINDQQLKEMDWLEGYRGPGESNLYDRVLLPVETDRGTMDAYVYTYANADEARRLPEVELGDWRISQVMMRDEWLFFAYGSAMDDQRFRMADVSHLFEDVVGRGELMGYNLLFSRRAMDGGRADISEGDGYVEGKVYRIHRDAVDYLFVREGVWGQFYRPVLLDLRVEGADKTDVLAFVCVDKDSEVAPPKWYADEILRGAKDCVSDAYLLKLTRHMESLAVDAVRP